MNSDKNTQPIANLESIKNVCDRTGMGKSWIYERIADKTFPQPIKIGRRTLFITEEITNWINNQIDQCRGQ